MEDELRTVFESREGFLYDVLRYHMGWVDQQGQPKSETAPLSFQSALALASCDALGGDFRNALPVAASVDLIYNFTLVHGDVQSNRAEPGDRPSIWWVWGPAQAINAGDGLHAHPTQALLDLYTVQDKLGSLEGLKVVIVGDVLHSRVARSDIWGFAKMGAKVVLSGPATLMPPDLMRTSGNLARSPFASLVEVDTDLDRAIEGADVVMALRLQQERQNAGFLPSIREYIRRWQVTDARLERARLGAMVMHPGPMNEGIEISNSIAHGGSSVIEDQVTNGVAVRMALLYQLTIGAGLES